MIQLLHTRQNNNLSNFKIRIAIIGFKHELCVQFTSESKNVEYQSIPYNCNKVLFTFFCAPHAWPNYHNMVNSCLQPSDKSKLIWYAMKLALISLARLALKWAVRYKIVGIQITKWTGLTCQSPLTLLLKFENCKAELINNTARNNTAQAWFVYKNFFAWKCKLQKLLRHTQRKVQLLCLNCVSIVITYLRKPQWDIMI